MGCEKAVDGKGVQKAEREKEGKKEAGRGGDGEWGERVGERISTKNGGGRGVRKWRGQRIGRSDRRS